MKPYLTGVFAACIAVFSNAVIADPSKLVDSFRVLSNPDVELLLDTAVPVMNSRRCRSSFRSYLRSTTKKYRAFAYTAEPDGTKWFCRWSRQDTQALADQKAVKNCQENAQRTIKTADCKLFASHDTLRVSVDDFEYITKPGDLFYAISKLSLSSVKQLVESGADIHQKNKNEETPLLVAFRENRIDVIEYLLEKGADINDKDMDGYDALNISAEKDSFILFEYVLSRGGDVNTHSTRTRKYPIHFAAQTKFGELRILEAILKEGGDINAQDHTLRTALHYASRSRRYTPLKYLIKNGAEINAENMAGDTPLDVAGDSRISQYLIKHGGKPGAD